MRTPQGYEDDFAARRLREERNGPKPETQHGIPCTDPFHVDGCTGAAGGDHELRATSEVWCAHCDQPTVFAVRMPYGIEPLCALHGLMLAEDAAAYVETTRESRVFTAPVGGIEQYQAEDR